ncbi:putative uncharacterized protein DDB_G0286901 [Anopheles albimanus]|uniref:putative uncharacterized protein DDB_G0286901 n=1 Tax=Anopheles albimanus TaxID=7167 RepID=UPI001641DC0A|nr:putative uncharacterized protein DDB_G0286901 [Anopheles albimanus]
MVTEMDRTGTGIRGAILQRPPPPRTPATITFLKRNSSRCSRNRNGTPKSPRPPTTGSQRQNGNNNNSGSSSSSNSNVNTLPGNRHNRSSTTTDECVLEPGASGSDHDNCNNNQSKPSTSGSFRREPIVGPAAPTTHTNQEQHNRINNNHLAGMVALEQAAGVANERAQQQTAPPPPLASRSNSGSTVDVDDEQLAVSDGDGGGGVGGDATDPNDTSTNTSDTVDQRLPVYV